MKSTLRKKKKKLIIEDTAGVIPGTADLASSHGIRSIFEADALTNTTCCIYVTNKPYGSYRLTESSQAETTPGDSHNSARVWEVPVLFTIYMNKTEACSIIRCQDEYSQMPEQFTSRYHIRCLDSHWKLALSALPAERVAMCGAVIYRLIIHQVSK